MSDLIRIAIVAVVTTVSLGVAWWSRARLARRGARVDVTGLIAGPGAVVFTKDDCATCLSTLELVEGLGLSIRQIRAEDEAGVFEARGVTGVPLTVVVDAAGRPRGQFGGLPPSRALRRAAGRAREIPDARRGEL